MLSYMVPSIEDKPPPIPAKHHLQLDLSPTSLPNGHGNGHHKENHDLPATHSPLDKAKSRKVTNGATKQTTLKRVSFGSSKGSMVETLIYESPVQEENEQTSPNSLLSDADQLQGADGAKCSASKVRVSFFECERPSVITPETGGGGPEPVDAPDGELDLNHLSSAAMNSTFGDHHPAYNRQASTDSGWDNPFRPDGDLSREADQIVELIKGGKPITPTPGLTPQLPSQPPAPAGAANGTPLKNGSAGAPADKKTPPGGVEVQRGTAGTPGDVEHIVIKKKPKCQCCVIL